MYTTTYPRQVTTYQYVDSMHDTMDCCLYCIVGIFMLRDKELKWFYQGPGAGYVFPQEWEAYEAAIPESERNDLIAAYGGGLLYTITHISYLTTLLCCCSFIFLNIVLY